METLLRKVTTNKYLPLRMFQSIEVDEKKIKILDDSGCAEDATTTGVVMSTMIPNEMNDCTDGGNAVPTTRSSFLLYGGTGRGYVKAFRGGSRAQCRQLRQLTNVQGEQKTAENYFLRLCPYLTTPESVGKQ